VVIDTNVLLVAEGLSGFSRPCEARCGKLLLAVRRDQLVVLDKDREILSEYAKKLSERKGQPGIGFAFWKWLINTKTTEARYEIVHLTLTLTEHTSSSRITPALRSSISQTANLLPSRPRIPASRRLFKPVTVNGGDGDIR